MTVNPATQSPGGDSKLLAAQLDLLAGVVAGRALPESLARLLRAVEDVSTDGMLASILLLDESGRQLLHGSAPSLPPAYSAAIHGTEIGPAVGSCGTAAYLRRQVIVEDIDTDPLWRDFRELALSSGLRACWSTPIFGIAGKLLGTFALYYPSPRAPSAGDLLLIDALVRTVAMAIERSKVDERREQQLAQERSFGLTFQRSVLPEIPARVGQLDVAARYRTGDPGVRVGGDWYDAIDLDDGVMLVVGDVQGHDVQAAALMAQLRTVVRAAACEGHPPSLILARAADYLERLGSDRLATVVCVQLDVDAQLATVASAGHPAPLVLAAHPDGLHAEALQVDPGPPLGIGQHWNEHSTRLPSDAVLLLYTDGLVENRAWAIGEGLSRLVQLLRRVPSHADLPLILDAVVELMPAGQRQDDVAVLSARLPCSAARGDRVSRRLPSHPISVPVARAWIRGWLAGADLGDAAVEAVELVVSELVTNAVRESDDHLRVMIESQGDSVLIEVFDSGHRLPGLADPAVDSTSGRGLRLVASLADDWGTREELSGKTVWARVGVRVPVG